METQKQEVKDLKGLENIIVELRNIEGVEAVFVLDRSGLRIKDNVPKNLNVDDLVAMLSTFFGSAEQVLAGLQAGQVSMVIADNPIYKIIVVGAGPNALLATVAKSTINLGLFLSEAERVRLKIKKILE